MEKRLPNWPRRDCGYLELPGRLSKNGSLPPIQHDFDFEFIGLIALSDPIREAVPAAVSECYQAGIRVIMITGDYPVTAMNIAREIGLKNHDVSISGSELQEMTEEELAERIKDVNVFARVIPEQKLKIVNALKRNGEIVAMTGDGSERCSCAEGRQYWDCHG